MGLTWGINKTNIAKEYIVEENFGQGNAINISKLSLREFIDCKKDLPLKSIEKLKNLRITCDPSSTLAKKNWRSKKALTQTILSLYWGFGIWGANSFFSIPITYSSKSVGKTGVLSIGSTSPLSSQAIDRWTLIANCIIGTLLNLEAEEKIILSTTNLAYRVGHPIKNRTNSVVNFTNNLVRDFQILLHKNKENLDLSMYQNFCEHEKDLKSLVKISNSLEGFGGLVNFLSAIMIEGNNLWTKKREEKWLNQNPLKLQAFFNKLAQESYHQNSPKLKLKINFDTGCNQLFLSCNAKNENKELFINEHLLSTIFYELTANAIHHGKEVDDIVVLNVSVSGEEKTLTLTNLIANGQAQETKETADYNIDGPGGETLAGHLLFQLIDGSPILKKRKYKKNGEYFFQYRINLKIKEKVVCTTRK
jgi:signal transduction histidine kinase